MTPLPLNSRIGILGDGQLGRMMALAAAPLGYQVHIFGQDPNSPAAQVSALTTVADYTDVKALNTFASSVDVVTLEFENVPVETLEILGHQVPVFPNSYALSIAQDRIREKMFIQDCGLAVTPFHYVKTRADLDTALKGVGANGILKTTRFGYDGKGQIRITSPEDAENAWAVLAGVPTIFEKYVPFEREVSVVLARGQNGDMAPFDVSDNTHRSHILHTSTVPSTLPPQQTQEAQRMACVLAEALDYVGVMAVEFFITQDQHILVNEIAPRPHNSGHWTMDGCQHSQFTQAIRAVCGLPLGTPQRHADVTMTNLIGQDVTRLLDFQSEAHTSIHLYGKKDTRDGRKMGHVNTVHPFRQA